MADNLNFEYGTTESQTNTNMTAGTGSSVTTTAIGTAVINGKWVTPLAVVANAPVPTADSTTGLPFVPMQPNMCCALVFGINHLGALLMSQGQVIACSAGAALVPGPVLIAPQFPDLPNDFVPLAYTIVTTAPGAAPWTPGTSAWTAAGVAFTPFQNVAQLPNRPQIA